MLEGRLGYYDAVLPHVADAISRVPHPCIIDLGCGSGLTSLYLGRLFPHSRVLRVERCASLVDRARDLQAKLRLSNVAFVCEDYRDDRIGERFDVVLSLQTMPTYYLPRIPSESPECYRRGTHLASVAEAPVLPSRKVAQTLTAIRRLARDTGCTVMHERLPDVSRALLFVYFACRAGLNPTEMKTVAWRTPAEAFDDAQSSPLVVAEAIGVKAQFDESALIECFFPRPAAAPLQRVGPGGGRTLTGPAAAACFDSLPAGRRDLCIRAVSADDEPFHVHLGIVADVLAYSYACNAWDMRQMTVADVGAARPLFQSVIEQLMRAGATVSMQPAVEILPGAVHELLAA